MMLFALSFGAAAVVAPTSAQLGARPAEVAACQVVRTEKADRSVQRGASPRSRALTEEPPAQQIKAVAYSEGGCLKPLVIHEEVGAPPVR